MKLPVYRGCPILDGVNINAFVHSPQMNQFDPTASYTFYLSSYNYVCQGFMVDNHPSARAKPEGKGVVIDHKFHGYHAVSIIYPT